MMINVDHLKMIGDNCWLIINGFCWFYMHFSDLPHEFHALLWLLRKEVIVIFTLVFICTKRTYMRFSDCSITEFHDIFLFLCKDVCKSSVLFWFVLFAGTFQGINEKIKGNQDIIKICFKNKIKKTPLTKLLYFSRIDMKNV